MVPARRMALMIMPPSAAAALYRDRHIFFILSGIRFLRRTTGTVIMIRALFISGPKRPMISA